MFPDNVHEVSPGDQVALCLLVSLLLLSLLLMKVRGI